jgi:hypothetical protein
MTHLRNAIRPPEPTILDWLLGRKKGPSSGPVYVGGGPTIRPPRAARSRAGDCGRKVVGATVTLEMSLEDLA